MDPDAPTELKLHLLGGFEGDVIDSPNEDEQHISPAPGSSIASASPGGQTTSRSPEKTKFTQKGTRGIPPGGMRAAKAVEQHADVGRAVSTATAELYRKLRAKYKEVARLEELVIAIQPPDGVDPEQLLAVQHRHAAIEAAGAKGAAKLKKKQSASDARDAKLLDLARKNRYLHMALQKQRRAAALGTGDAASTPSARKASSGAAPSLAFGSKASGVSPSKQSAVSDDARSNEQGEVARLRRQASQASRRAQAAQRQADESRVRAMQLERALRNELGEDIPLQDVVKAVSSSGAESGGFRGPGGAGRTGWRGRAQRIVMLKARVKKLQKQLQDAGVAEAGHSASGGSSRGADAAGRGASGLASGDGPDEPEVPLGLGLLSGAGDGPGGSSPSGHRSARSGGGSSGPVDVDARAERQLQGIAAARRAEAEKAVRENSQLQRELEASRREAKGLRSRMKAVAREAKEAKAKLGNMQEKSEIDDRLVEALRAERTKLQMKVAQMGREQASTEAGSPARTAFTGGLGARAARAAFAVHGRTGAQLEQDAKDAAAAGHAASSVSSPAGVPSSSPGRYSVAGLATGGGAAAGTEGGFGSASVAGSQMTTGVAPEELAKVAADGARVERLARQQQRRIDVQDKMLARLKDELQRVREENDRLKGVQGNDGSSSSALSRPGSAGSQSGGAVHRRGVGMSAGASVRAAAALEVRAAEAESRLRVAEHDCARLRGELKRARERSKGLERQVEEYMDRSTGLEERCRALDLELGRLGGEATAKGAAGSRGRGAKSSAPSSSAKQQRLLDRLKARVATLENYLEAQRANYEEAVEARALDAEGAERALAERQAVFDRALKQLQERLQAAGLPAAAVQGQVQVQVQGGGNSSSMGGDGSRGESRGGKYNSGGGTMHHRSVSPIQTRANGAGGVAAAGQRRAADPSSVTQDRGGARAASHHPRPPSGSGAAAPAARKIRPGSGKVSGSGKPSGSSGLGRFQAGANRRPATTDSIDSGDYAEEDRYPGGRAFDPPPVDPTFDMDSGAAALEAGRSGRRRGGGPERAGADAGAGAGGELADGGMAAMGGEEPAFESTAGMQHSSTGRAFGQISEAAAQLAQSGSSRVPVVTRRKRRM